jgi:hypothetical protein
MTERTWQRGDTVVLRFPAERRMTRCYQVIHGDPVVCVTGWPGVVLEDSNELIAVYMPEGTKLWRWNIEQQQFREPNISRGDSIRLFFPGKRYEVSLFYETGSEPAPHVEYFFPGVTGRFYGWKIDLASPFVRTEVGIDMIDETLDIMVSPDGSFRWKDEDQMAIFVELGMYSSEEAGAIRSIGDEVIDLIERRLPPFDERWREWHPEARLKLGQVPEAWPHLPVPSPYMAYDLREDSAARIEAAKRLHYWASLRRPRL